MNNRLNKYKYPGAKRLMLEAQELKDNTEDYCAQPIDDNLFEWHFTVRGPPDTAFDGGYYHGRLSFPTEYPMKPPSIILLTPNGRFETNKKICLSISGYHPETWQPSWSVRTALLALIAFMPTQTNKAIGSLDFSDVERRDLARKSRTWTCETCGLIKNLLKHPESTNQVKINEKCEPSTSEICQDLSNNNIKKDRSNELCDSDESITKLESDTSQLDNRTDAERCKVDSENRNEISNDQVIRQSRTTSLGLAPEDINSLQSGRDNSTRVIVQNLNDRRRSYPPLVLKSIFILLSLLILRRVVMVIQS